MCVCVCVSVLCVSVLCVSVCVFCVSVCVCVRVCKKGECAHHSTISKYGPHIQKTRFYYFFIVVVVVRAFFVVVVQQFRVFFLSPISLYNISIHLCTRLGVEGE
jgi:hypothetical protein